MWLVRRFWRESGVSRIRVLTNYRYVVHWVGYRRLSFGSWIYASLQRFQFVFLQEFLPSISSDEVSEIQGIEDPVQAQLLGRNMVGHKIAYKIQQAFFQARIQGLGKLFQVLSSCTTRRQAFSYITADHSIDLRTHRIWAVMALLNSLCGSFVYFSMVWDVCSNDLLSLLWANWLAVVPLALQIWQLAPNRAEPISENIVQMAC